MDLFYNMLRLFNGCFRAYLAVGFCLLTFQAAAIIDANSASNTNAPSDGSPWANVGRIGGGASGVYVGGGWVLTASHVGSGPIELNGTTFSPDGQSLRLTNSDGTATDLILFHLSTIPLLPSVPLVTSTPAAFTQIDMVGYGLIAGSAQTSIGIYTGFYWSSFQVKSWGNNKINLGGVSTISIGYGTVSVFAADFTSPGTLGPTSQTSDEGQVAPGDSGGAAFVKNGSVWQLAGILDAEGTQANQAGSTAVYGDLSYAADVATYRTEIMAVLKSGPPPPLTLKNSGGNWLACWPDMGVAYTLESSGSLAQPNWSPVSQSQVTTNGQTCVLVPNSGSLKLFRLQKP